MEKALEVERSIIKTYRKTIWSKFIQAIQDYELISDGDHIMVCISGGKDSFLLAKCIQELKKHGRIHFEASYVVMDPGYREENRKQICENAKLLHIPIEIFQTDIFKVVDHVAKEKPCYLCARMRRGYLYDYAKKIGCNKIALGHHFDDMLETLLLSMMYGSEIKTMLPKLQSEHFSGLELIRPLYLIKEKDILAWRDFHQLTFINCACRFTEKTHLDATQSKRQEVKQLLMNLRKINPNVDYNLFKSIGNINLDAVLGFRKDGKKYTFFDQIFIETIHEREEHNDELEAKE